MKRVETVHGSPVRLLIWMVLVFSLGAGAAAEAEPIFEQASGTTCEERLFLCHREEARLEEEKRQCVREQRTCKHRLRNCRDKLSQCEIDADTYRQKADECEAQLAGAMDLETEDGGLSVWDVGFEERVISRSQASVIDLDVVPDVGGQIGSVFCEAQLSVCRISVGVKEGELESCRDRLANMPCTQKLDACEINVEFCEEERDDQKRRWLECRAILNGR
ncbi:MAG: hypothetical protein CL936_04190 [Deltaproteobacteria bacterium]|nr:hypothetical protein [Deltaproteobacteria bacterium]